MTVPTYRLMKKRCNQCLTTPARIVSAERAAQLLADCQDTHTKFICHKTTDVACRGVHEATGGCLAWRFAQVFAIPVEEVDPNDLP